MASDIVGRLEKAYASGDMDELKASILPFVRKNREKLLEFIQAFQKVEGPCPLDRLIKFFIIQNNMPFDMSQYMARQSTMIKKEMETDKSQAGQDRQANVAAWIKQKAEAHRSTSMFEQVYCFDKLKQELLPLIEEELGLHPETAAGGGFRPDGPEGPDSPGSRAP